MQITRVDTRADAPAQQFGRMRRHLIEAGLGIVDIERPEGSSGGHLLVGNAYAGMRNVVGTVHVDDPSSTVVRLTPNDDLAICLAVSTGPLTIITDGERRQADPGQLLLTATSHELEQRSAVRAARAGLTVRRSDLSIDDEALALALAGDLRWHDGHRELMIGTARSAWRFGTARLLRLDSTALDRHLADVLDRILLSALSSIHGPRFLSRQTDARRRKHDALRYIDQSLFDSELGRDSIAAALNLSVRQLSRAFEGGPGVDASITMARVEQADRLVRSPHSAHLSLAEIARVCRFQSISHFGRSYREHIGRSPRQVRNEIIRIEGVVGV